MKRDCSPFFRRHCLAVALCMAASGGPLAHAATVHVGRLSATATHQQFIVAYRDGTLAPPTASIERRLDAAVARTRAGGSIDLQARVLRQMQVGPYVMRASRPLDAAEATRFMQALALDPLVEHVDVDALNQPALDPDDPRIIEQWGFGTSAASLNIRPAWDLAAGAGQVVAVLDTGITRHPDLDANVLPGYDFISDPQISRDGNGRDDDPSDEGDWYGPNECQRRAGADSSWHGTHVAGTVAAVTRNGTGVAGTAFEAKVLPVRVLGKCGGYDSDIADAMVWASGAAVRDLPLNPHPARTINLSLGARGDCPSGMQLAIDTARAHGATVVIAAGNWTIDVAGFSPANCRGVIAVGATNSTGAPAWFSNYGTGITLAAPGEDILSTLNDGRTVPANPTYVAYEGTSMAAPHVAGVVALMQSVAPVALTPSKVETLITRTARALPKPCPLGCGAGLTDAAAAVMAAALETDPGDPVVELESDVAVTGLSAGEGQELAFTIKVPAGTGQLILAMSGGSGNADLYTRYGEAPTDEDFNCAPQAAGNQETCIRVLPTQGVWHVRIVARSGFSGVSLKGSLR